jgi:hypothetical protein
MVSLLRGAEAQPAFRTDENYNCLHPADHRAIMRPDSPGCQYQTDGPPKDTVDCRGHGRAPMRFSGWPVNSSAGGALHGPAAISM